MSNTAVRSVRLENSKMENILSYRYISLRNKLMLCSPLLNKLFINGSLFSIESQKMAFIIKLL